MKYRLLPIYALFLLVFLSCYQKPEFPDTPELRFISMDKDTLLQGFSREDSLTLWLELTDGDGDIGVENTDTVSQSILIRDLRTGNVSEQFRIPFIPENVAANGIQAEMQLKLYTTCCLFPDNIPPCSVIAEYPRDTLIYEIVILDRAGHRSTPIQTPPIILRCQ